MAWTELLYHDIGRTQIQFYGALGSGNKEVILAKMPSGHLVEQSQIEEIGRTMTKYIDSLVSETLFGVDLSDNPHMSSAMIGTLIHVNNQLGKKGLSNLALVVDPKTSLRSTLGVTKLDRLFRVYGTRDQLLQ